MRLQLATGLSFALTFGWASVALADIPPETTGDTETSGTTGTTTTGEGGDDGGGDEDGCSVGSDTDLGLGLGFVALILAGAALRRGSASED